MDTQSINDLQHPEWNPRRIQEFDFNNLVNSLKEFGDLSPVVRNVISSNIVGGNQRVEAFKRLNTNDIVITQRMPEPTRTGTVALGYIVMPDGERYSYREVSWPFDAQDENGQPYSSKEKAGAVAANHITGDDDYEKLAKLDYDLSLLDNGQDLLALTGQTEQEIADLLQSVSGEPILEPNTDKPEKPDDGLQRTKFKFTQDQHDVVYQAIAQMKHDRPVNNGPSPDSDSNALHYICQSYLENTMSQNNENTPQTSPDQTAPQTPSQPVYTPAQAPDVQATQTNTTPDLTSIPTY